MTRQRRGLRTLVIGLLLGLVLGGAGVAVAAPPTTKTIKKIVTKQVKKLAPKLTVAQAGNADALGGAPASAYLKTSGTRADGVATSGDLDITAGAFTTILSKSITAPSDGYFFVVASLTGSLLNLTPGAHGILDYGLAVDGAALTTDASYHALVTYAEAFQESGAISAVVPVSAGQHTITLQVREQGAGTKVLGRDLSALFVPTGSAPVLPY